MDPYNTADRFKRKQDTVDFVPQEKAVVEKIENAIVDHKWREERPAPKQPIVGRRWP